MTISSVSATNSLLKQLEANGLSADKAKLVGNDLAAAEKAGSGSAGTSAATTSSESVRATLDAKIDADVSSGKLSKSDAAVVKKTLDDIDGESSGSGITSQAAPTATAASPGGSAAGGGGGGGSASKTELSETVTISGSTETTIITYTDGTTETTTTVATDADKVKYGKPSSTNATSDTASDAAKTYLSTIAPGSLIDQTA